MVHAEGREMPTADGSGEPRQAVLDQLLRVGRQNPWWWYRTGMLLYQQLGGILTDDVAGAATESRRLAVSLCR